MEKFACIYFEGSDSKAVLFSKENNVIKIIKAQSIDLSHIAVEKKMEIVSSEVNQQGGIVNLNVDSQENYSGTYINKFGRFFEGEDINKIKFISILSEPAVYLRKIEDDENSQSLKTNSGGKAVKSSLEYIRLADGSRLEVYPSGKFNYISILKGLAAYFNKRNIKLYSTKCAELSLAGYIAEKKNFSPEDTSLIIHVTKEHTKMLFMEGKSIRHIAAQIQTGKNSPSFNSIIQSKINFAMDNEGILSIDNIIVSGDDEPDKLIGILRYNFPDSEVSALGFNEYEVISSELMEHVPLSVFSVPIAVAEEYRKEADENYRGINLLPESVKEEQKPFRLDRHGYLVIGLLFISAFFFSIKIVSNIKAMKQLEIDIRVNENLKNENSRLNNQINVYTEKINNYTDYSLLIDQLSQDQYIWSDAVKRIGDFTGLRRNLWITKLELDSTRAIRVGGFALNRKVLTDFAGVYYPASLENVVFESIKDQISFKYNLTYESISSGARP